MSKLIEPKHRQHTRTVEDRCELANRLSQVADLSLVFLTFDEVALLAGINTRMVESLCQSGVTPTPIRLGHRTVRFNAAEVIEWLRSK